MQQSETHKEQCMIEDGTIINTVNITVYDTISNCHK